MATIKSYTDLEQSKVLSKILPLESADMTYYACVRDWRGNPVKPRWGKPANALRKEMAVPCANHQVYEYVSAWSLAALLGVLPTMIGNVFEKDALRLRIDKSETDFNIWYSNLDTDMVEEGFDVIKTNPVDACVEMIIRLNELKML